MSTQETQINKNLSIDNSMVVTRGEGIGGIETGNRCQIYGDSRWSDLGSGYTMQHMAHVS